MPKDDSKKDQLEDLSSLEFVDYDDKSLDPDFELSKELKSQYSDISKQLASKPSISTLKENPVRNNETFDDFSISDDKPSYENVREIHGSAFNIEKVGSPILNAQNNIAIRYVFFPTWRSQCLLLCQFFLFSLLAIWGSSEIPASVIRGKLFGIGGITLYLYLPVLTLIPGFILGKILINLYDAKYIIDSRGVEAQIGLVSMSLRQPSLRWEDIRGVEPNQTIWERLLGIGSVLIGSAMTQDVEIVMKGVANPRAIQLLIGGERDRQLKRLKEAQVNETHGAD